MKPHILFIVSLLMFLSCPVLGQVADVQNDHDTKGYEFLVSDKVNTSGTFVTFFLKKGNTKTLVLKNIKTGVELRFSNVHKEPVLTDRFMICYNYKNSELYRVSLNNYRKDTLKDVTDYRWIERSGKMLVYGSNSQTLKLTDGNLKECSRLSDVVQFHLSPDQGTIAAFTPNTVAVYNLAAGCEYSEYELSDCLRIKTVKWSPDGSQLYLIGNNSRRFEVNLVNSKKITPVFSGSLIDSLNNTRIDTLFSHVRMLSNELMSFGTRSLAAETKKYGPEIWLGDSENLSPSIDKKKHAQVQLGILNLNKRTFHNLHDTSKVLHFSVNHGGNKVFAYEEQDDYSKFIPDIHVYSYSTDLLHKSFFSAFSGQGVRIFNIKDIDALFYIVEGQWYYHDMKTDKTHSLTVSDKAVFSIPDTTFHFKQNDPRAQSIISYGKNKVLFNDFYDIWIFDIKSKTSRRITNGREEQRVYSLAGLNTLKDYEPWSWNSEMTLPKADDLLVQWRSVDFTYEGVALVKRNGKTIQLFNDQARYTQIYRNGNLITYRKERADTPPELYLFDLKTAKEMLLYKSNNWDVTAGNSTTEYIKWRDRNDKVVGAVVRLPVGYDSTKNYPAIFSIYEDKSEAQHYYNSPFENDVSGFNYRHYTSKGYIVVEPDIYYEYGAPGGSATKCVLEALDKVSGLYSVDVANVGLIGHSFGGYETNFIVSQTNRFKTAVSGAGIADIISWYLSVNPTTHRPEFWRYPEQSFRMKLGLFDIKDRYLENSPILQSDKVETPLLLWSGKEDYHVNWNQSVEMFLALKKQRKAVNLLLYHGEEHTLYGEKSKKNLKEKVMSWFDYYLKDNDRPEWLKE